jgi:hypothetical protein
MAATTTDSHQRGVSSTRTVQPRSVDEHVATTVGRDARLDRAMAKHLPDSWLAGTSTTPTWSTRPTCCWWTGASFSSGGCHEPGFLATREAQFGPAYVSQLLASVLEPVGMSPMNIAGAAWLRRRTRHSLTKVRR